MYNLRKYVHPDPLEFLYKYRSVPDREVVGLIASVLAYGRVEQILKSVARVLDLLGPHPAAYLSRVSPRLLERGLAPFKHRFTTGREMFELLITVKKVRDEYGSLNNALRACGGEDDDIRTALDRFSRLLCPCGSYLVPCPRDGSACKRLNLYLRWMVRSDAVDPGGWKGISPRSLMIPLDTHMAKIGKMLGMTSRKSAGMNMALDITEAFRKISPEDPVKYDFVLTRFGIRRDFRDRSLV